MFLCQRGTSRSVNIQPDRTTTDVAMCAGEFSQKRIDDTYTKKVSIIGTNSTQPT